MHIYYITVQRKRRTKGRRPRSARMKSTPKIFWTNSTLNPTGTLWVIHAHMVHSSITDHILKRSSFWLALAMPLKFGIVGKLLVRRTRESFPFRERRWHIWITSSSQSASADWLSDSNGRSLWPISAAYGAAATTVSTVSTVIFAFFLWQMTAAFLGGVSFRLTCNSAATKKRSEFASCLFRHDLPTLDRFFFLFYLLSFASLAFSMEELEPLIVIIFPRVSCTNWLDSWLLAVHGENGRIWRKD